MSQAERDAAYNNSAACPDGAARVARWTEASLATRARPESRLDIAYQPGERTRWDLFPAARADAPCLVFIHGGYWQRNSREMFACMADGVLAHGWSAALPGYTLAPDATLARIAEEITAALDWLQQHRNAYGLTGRIVVSGWSAGAHLAALSLAHPLVSAGLAISGVYELAPIADTYLNDKLCLAPDEIASLSPLRLPAIAKPLTITYGENELPRLVADSRAMHAMRSAARAPGSLLPQAGHDHFSILEELRAPAGKLTQAALALA